MDAVCHVEELPHAARRSTEGTSHANISETEQELASSCLPQAQQTSRLESGVLRHPNVGPTLQQKFLEPGKTAHTAAQDSSFHSAKRSGVYTHQLHVLLAVPLVRSWEHTATQMTRFCVSSSALENCLGCKTQSLQNTDTHWYDSHGASRSSQYSNLPPHGC